MSASAPWATPGPACSQCRRTTARPAAQVLATRCEWWCARCASPPLVNKSDVLRVHGIVDDFLQKHLGLCMTTWLKASDIGLVRPEEWMDASGRYQLGEARTQVRVHHAADGSPTGVMPTLVRAEVRLLLGLPLLDAARVLAHEAFHVFSAARGLDLQPQQEEGIANLWAYLLLAVHPGSEMVEELRVRMLRDADAIYGDGFRWARQGYKRCRGFADFLGQIECVPRAPPLRASPRTADRGRP